MLNPDCELPDPGSLQKVLRWSGRHWVRIVVAVLGLLVVEQVATLPFGEISQLAKKNPGKTAFMVHEERVARKEGRYVKILQHWVPLKDISPDVVHAVIVAEDGTFWSNHGFDWYELKESIERDVQERKAVRGASTITQQLVKNLYLSPSKSPVRKIKEWILTWWMDRQLSKTRILELYLNVIEWGYGVYGVEAASMYYFGKSAQYLTKMEAARLAAIIPRPKDQLANSDSEYVLGRVEIILNRMEARGY
jgi:monofunctional biosynthetic peptidoglycan transglycosylase